jgi:hypothetical protein
MVKTKHTTMTLALGILLVLFSTAFAAAPAQESVDRTASSPTSPQQLGWSGWSEVPGNGFTLSGPATTFYNGNFYVFVRGTNDHLYVNFLNGTTWSGWSEVPGHGLTPSAPGAVTFGNTLYLFVRGTDNKIYANTLNGTTWSGWIPVPGNGFTLSGPKAATNMANFAAQAEVLSLVVRGTNDHLYVNTFNGISWSGWSEVPGHGLTPSSPGATRFVTGIGATLELFVRGTDNKIYENFFNTMSWSGWRLVPGNGFTPDAPGATAFSNTLYLFVRGTNDRIYVNILRVPA